MADLGLSEDPDHAPHAEHLISESTQRNRKRRTTLTGGGILADDHANHSHVSELDK